MVPGTSDAFSPAEPLTTISTSNSGTQTRLELVLHGTASTLNGCVQFWQGRHTPSRLER